MYMHVQAEAQPAQFENASTIKDTELDGESFLSVHVCLLSLVAAVLPLLGVPCAPCHRGRRCANNNKKMSKWLVQDSAGSGTDSSSTPSTEHLLCAPVDTPPRICAQCA